MSGFPAFPLAGYILFLCDFVKDCRFVIFVTNCDTDAINKKYI